MSVIVAAIGSNKFELIRDRIGAILADELTHQFVLTSDQDLNVSVWNSRFIPFDHSETPSVNVNFFTGSLNSSDMTEVANSYKYSIDCHMKAKSGSGIQGDSTALVKVQKLLGVCRAILDDPQYRTLAFPAPSIWTTWIESLEIANPMGKEHDIESMVMARLVFVVKINEDNVLLNAHLLNGSNTSVKLDLTDKGFLYIVNSYM